MRTVQLPFFSNGMRLDADLHLPDTGDGPFPTVVPASGFQGLKVIHPARFARALTPLGYAVLAFDYRGFGLSEGERGRLVPQEWVEDIRAAVDRLSCHPAVDTTRLALVGWGLGGGVVVVEAADDERIRAVVACNGIADGYRSTRNQHDDESWQRLLSRMGGDRGARATYGRSEMTSPWDIVRLDLDQPTETYVADELYRAPGFGSGVTLESASYLLRFRPVDFVHRIAPRPLLIVHGAENRLHTPVEARELYAAAGEPKRLELLDGCGHTEWMFDGNPVFQRVVAMVDEHFSAAFADAAEPAEPAEHARVA